MCASNAELATVTATHPSAVDCGKTPGVIELVELGADGSVDPSPERFMASLRGPTLFHRKGRDASRVRVVSGLMHGNEPSGFRAIHAALSLGLTAETDVWFLLSAVDAARTPPGFAHRMLPGRRDFNRCWRAPFVCRDGASAHAALEVLLSVTPEAVIDLHNNTGRNPAYVMAQRSDPETLAFCSLFSPRVVLSAERLGTFAEAFDSLCPSITIECGRSHDPAADGFARQSLERFLSLRSLATLELSTGLTVLESPTRVRLREGLSVAFGDRSVPSVDLTLNADIDRHNFKNLPIGTALGWVRSLNEWPLEAHDSHGHERSRSWFALAKDTLVTRVEMVPFMLTTSVAAVLADCLFYTSPRDD